MIITLIIGKLFYDLAKLYGKNKWNYAIGAIAFYYISNFVFGMVLAIIAMLINPNLLEETNEVALNFMGVFFGIGVSYGLYFLLKKNLSKNKTVDENLNDMLHEIGTKENQ